MFTEIHFLLSLSHFAIMGTAPIAKRVAWKRERERERDVHRVNEVEQPDTIDSSVQLQCCNSIVWLSLKILDRLWFQSNSSLLINHDKTVTGIYLHFMTFMAINFGLHLLTAITKVLFLFLRNRTSSLIVKCNPNLLTSMVFSSIKRIKSSVTWIEAYRWTYQVLENWVA